MPLLLLQTAVAVVPVGAALGDGEAVGKGLARFNSGKADARDAIHLEGQQDAVPMNRRGVGQAVGDANGGHLSLEPADQRARDGVIDSEGGG